MPVNPQASLLNRLTVREVQCKDNTTFMTHEKFVFAWEIDVTIVAASVVPGESRTVIH